MDGNWPTPDSHQSINSGISVSGNARRQQSQTSGTDDEAEEDESESSALFNFRKQWEAELKHVSAGHKSHKTNTPTQLSTASSVPFSNTPTQFSAASPANANSCSPRRQSTSHTPVPTAAPSITDKIEEEAKKFFLMGVSFERRGDLYDAVRFYRRAMQLIPDIERRVQMELLEDDPGMHEDMDPENETSHGRDGNMSEEDDEDEDDERSLYGKFIQRIEANDWQFFQKGKEDGKVHFADFPVEILIYILRWVVSSDLDVRSLDILATVCRGFYCLSRDEKLWKMACDRVWKSCDILGSQFSTYREMFLSRPRVRFDGCYISRITYVRPGEHSFQDASYRPWHMVEYFRYIRFYPDGKLLFLTTAEKPVATVGILRRDASSRNPTVLRGTYHLYGNNVISASVRKVTVSAAQGTGSGRPGKNIKSALETVTEFQMDFEIEEMKGKSNWLLRWTYYAVYINNTNLRNNNNGDLNGGGGITSTFELSPNKYPPLYFSRVKSYTINSEKILE